MVAFIAIVVAALLLRLAFWLSAPGSTRRETEMIFTFLAITVAVYGVFVLRVFNGRLAAAAVVLAGVLILSSATGALVRRLGIEFTGAAAPKIHNFHQPLVIPAAVSGGSDALRLEMRFRADDPLSLQRRFDAVRAGELQLIVRVPSSCDRPCELRIIDPVYGRQLDAARRDIDFEVRITGASPFVPNVAQPLILDFAFSGQLVLFARDVGSASSARTDALTLGDRRITVPHDGTVFVRFMFVDRDWRPHSAIY